MVYRKNLAVISQIFTFVWLPLSSYFIKTVDIIQYDKIPSTLKSVPYNKSLVTSVPPQNLFSTVRSEPRIDLRIMILVQMKYSANVTYRKSYFITQSWFSDHFKWFKWKICPLAYLLASMMLLRTLNYLKVKYNFLDYEKNATYIFY